MKTAVREGIRFSLALDQMFPCYSIYDRIGIAADLGFKGVEIGECGERLDARRVRKAADSAGIDVAIIEGFDRRGATVNLPLESLRPAVERSIKFARELNCPIVVLFCGEIARPGDAPKSLIIENLKRLAPLAEKSSVTLAICPRNSLGRNRAQYLNSSAMALEIAKCVDSPRIRVLYDMYHMQMMEGDIVRSISANAAWIAHVRISSVPGHAEPFFGEINAPLVLSEISGQYRGFVGLDYVPIYEHRASAAESLHYLGQYAGATTAEYRGRASVPREKFARESGVR